MILVKVLLLLSFISCTSKILRAPSSVILIEKDHNIGIDDYWIVKPAGKFSSRLPVVYFLHGRAGSRLSFKENGGVAALEKYLKAGGVPFAVVGLTGTKWGKDSYWINQTRDKILSKIIPKIESKYSIGGVDNRMIAGNSMGSHGAFQMALTTNLFRCVAGHSIVIRDYESMNRQFPGLFGSKEDFAKRDPLGLLREISSLPNLPFKKAWIDIGGKDSEEFISQARLMEAELLRLNFNPDSLDVGLAYPEGAHDSAYLQARMSEYISWYGGCFKN